MSKVRTKGYERIHVITPRGVRCCQRHLETKKLYEGPVIIPSEEFKQLLETRKENAIIRRRQLSEHRIVNAYIREKIAGIAEKRKKGGNMTQEDINTLADVILKRV